MDAAGFGMSDLTLSFVPDGTLVAGRPSELFSAQGGQLASGQTAPTGGAQSNAPQGGAAAWQEAVFHAAQRWVDAAAVNIGIVADEGLPLGVGGATQRDPRFGDIRIAAVPLGEEVISVSVPHADLQSGTWAGDIVLNSQALPLSPSELEGVLVHELGHVLGLPHSDEPESPLHSHGIPASNELTELDVLAVQQIYGARSADWNEQGKANDRPKRATEFKYSSSWYDGSTPLIVYGDLSDRQDVDFFALKTASRLPGPISWELRTDGISLLDGQLEVFDSRGRLVATGAADQAGEPLRATLSRPVTGESYFARVSASPGTDFAVGKFALVATFDQLLTTPEAVIEEVARGPYQELRPEELQKRLVDDQLPLNEDAGLNDTPQLADGLKPVSVAAGVTRFEQIASLELPGDVDFYSLKSPETDRDVPQPMLVRVVALERGGVVPRVTLFDGDMQPLETELLVRGNGEYVVRLPQAESRTNYLIRVESERSGLFDVGNYHLAATFGGSTAGKQLLTAGSLSPAASVQYHSLYIAQSQVMHLGLGVSDVDPGADPLATTVWARLFNEAGQLVYQVAVHPGEFRTAQTIVLTPGTYTLQVAAVSREVGGSPPELAYMLFGQTASLPIGAELLDPTTAPFQDPNSDNFLYPGDIVSTEPLLVTDPVPDATVTDTVFSDPLWTDALSIYWVDDWLSPGS